MLKKLLFYILCFLIPPNLVEAFTEEQKKVLEYVNEHGGAHKKDIAAIVIQESFVGNKVIRHGDGGKAHGVGQMHIPTAKHTLAYHDKPIPQNQQLKKKLLTDDEFAVKMIVKYYRYLLKKFRYDRKLAILAYNVGPTKIKRTGLQFDPNNYLAKVLDNRKELVRENIL